MACIASSLRCARVGFLVCRSLPQNSTLQECHANEIFVHFWLAVPPRFWTTCPRRPTTWVFAAPCNKAPLGRMCRAWEAEGPDIGPIGKLHPCFCASTRYSRCSLRSAKASQLFLTPKTEAKRQGRNGKARPSSPQRSAPSRKIQSHKPYIPSAAEDPAGTRRKPRNRRRYSGGL